MNKIVLSIGLLILGIGVLGAGAYLMSNRASDNADTSPSPNSSTSGDTFSGTFLDLLALGQDKVCTFDNTDDSGTRTEGSVYMTSGGDRLNADFTVHQTDGSFDGNVIRDGDFTYIWTSLQEQGVKIEITPENESLFGEWAEGDNNNTGLNDDTEVDFNCNNWNVDTAMFVPPSDVEFVDITETFSQLRNMTGGQCSVCEELPEGDARTQCLAALNCNQ